MRSTPSGAGAPVESMPLRPADAIDPLFRATVEATEEAIVNALVAAETLVGHRGRRLEAIDREKLASLFGYSRLPCRGSMPLIARNHVDDARSNRGL